MSRKEMCPRRPKLNTHEEQALRLRTLGLTYREIANQLGVHTSTAHSRVMRGLRELRQRQHEAPGDVRHLELLKLAQLERRVMAEAVGGDHGAIRLLLRIMDARKRYLATCLPSTSSEEDLEELLRVFTQPLMGEDDEDGGPEALLTDYDDELEDVEAWADDLGSLPGEASHDEAANPMNPIHDDAVAESDLFPAVVDLARAVT